MLHSRFHIRGQEGYGVGQAEMYLQSESNDSQSTLSTGKGPVTCDISTGSLGMSARP